MATLQSVEIISHSIETNGNDDYGWIEFDVRIAVDGVSTDGHVSMDLDHADNLVLCGNSIDCGFSTTLVELARDVSSSDDTHSQFVKSLVRELSFDAEFEVARGALVAHNAQIHARHKALRAAEEAALASYDEEGDNDEA